VGGRSHNNSKAGLVRILRISKPMRHRMRRALSGRREQLMDSLVKSSGNRRSRRLQRLGKRLPTGCQPAARGCNTGVDGSMSLHGLRHLPKADGVPRVARWPLHRRGGGPLDYADRDCGYLGQRVHGRHDELVPVGLSEPGGVPVHLHPSRGEHQVQVERAEVFGDSRMDAGVPVPNAGGLVLAHADAVSQHLIPAVAIVGEVGVPDAGAPHGLATWTLVAIAVGGARPACREHRERQDRQSGIYHGKAEHWVSHSPPVVGRPSRIWIVIQSVPVCVAGLPTPALTRLVADNKRMLVDYVL
jgi:hypothetical protein